MQEDITAYHGRLALCSKTWNCEVKRAAPDVIVHQTQVAHSALLIVIHSTPIHHVSNITDKRVRGEV